MFEHNGIRVFGAGRNSPPAVIVREPTGRNRCNSDTDSIVWMREGVYSIIVMLFFVMRAPWKTVSKRVSFQKGVFFMSHNTTPARTARVKKLVTLAMLTAVTYVVR